MSECLKHYIEKFGHVVGREFTLEEIPVMERVAAAHQKSYWDSFNADCKRNQELH